MTTTPHPAAADARRLTANAARPRAERLHAVNGVDRLAQGAVHALAERIRHDRLDLIDRTMSDAGADVRSFGAEAPQLTATVTVHDPRAYVALLAEGSAGLGRGFVEGWWSTPDPVAVVRVLARNIAGLQRARAGIHRVLRPVSDPLRRLRRRDSRQQNREDIGAHYDIGNDFFALFLDETMSYSSAVFDTRATSLAEASVNKFEILLDKLDVRPGDHLLEIGSGWGGFAVHAAATRGCWVTTTTISAEQREATADRVRTAGLAGRVTVLGDDWRDLSGTFDRVVSIEMIEAVDWRDYASFFATIERCLRPDGLAALQAICLPDHLWGHSKDSGGFIRRFVFPNGYLPSVAAIDGAVKDATAMRLVGLEDFTDHYAETLRRWRLRFGANLDGVRRQGLDERFCRLWDFYLAYCEAGFHERQITLAQVVLAGRDRRQSWRPLPNPGLAGAAG